MKKKIYVASSWKNRYQQLVVALLRSFGHEVYDFKNPTPENHGFSWSQIDKDWEKWKPEDFVKALEHPISEQGFKYDFDAMKWADTCIMVLPCGRSAHTEAGWMKGMGKDVYVLMLDKEVPELMYKVYDGIITSLSDLNLAFGLPGEELPDMIECGNEKCGWCGTEDILPKNKDGYRHYVCPECSESNFYILDK